MTRMLELFPDVQGDELAMLKERIEVLDDAGKKLFASVYRTRRRDPQMVGLSALAGLLVLPGLQRFVVNQIGMGILYLFTIGLCFIGSIVDLINYRTLAFDYNRKIADEVFILVQNDMSD